ncbi:MAG: hypothetical protein AB7G40_05490 [Hyphomonadaceae bacterium]
MPNTAKQPPDDESAYWHELNPSTYLDAAQALHQSTDSAAIFATAFRMMLEATFLQKFHDDDYLYLYTSVAGLSSLYLLKKGELDGFDRSFLSRLPWRAAPVLFNEQGKLRIDIALRLFRQHEQILAGAADSLVEGCSRDRVDALQVAFRTNLTLIRAIDDRAALTPAPLFRERTARTGDRRPTAMEHFLEHWAWRVLVGEVFLDELKAADPQLYTALAQHQHRQGERLSDLVPPSPTKGRKPHIRTPDEQLAERRRVAALRMQRHRKASRAKWPPPTGS